MLTVREDYEAEEALDEACKIWARAREAWEVITWVLSPDPTKGQPLTESGLARSLVYGGSYAHETPTITVLYVIEDPHVTIQRARFAQAKTTGGHA